MCIYGDNRMRLRNDTTRAHVEPFSYDVLQFLASVVETSRFSSDCLSP